MSPFGVMVVCVAFADADADRRGEDARHEQAAERAGVVDGQADREGEQGETVDGILDAGYDAS